MKKKLKPTPGKWIVLHNVNGEIGRFGVFQQTEDDLVYHIATIENGAPGDYLDTEEANAKLMAAAPEMYQLLYELLEVADRGTISVTQEKVRSFLQRLEGSDAA